jgi:drug/metabolite transporter (DMT)-like permease
VIAPPRRAEATGTAALVGAGLLFGTTFVVMQDAIERAEVLPFLAVRFAVGALVLLPFALGRPSAPGELRVGIVAGLCLLVGYLFQTVGLQYTSSTTSAFITYLLVVFVPILTAVMTRRPPERSIIVAVVLAVTGLLLMSGGLDGFGRGELLTLGAAFAFAVHILILSRTSHRYDPVRLTCWQVAVVSLACIGPGIGAGGYGFDRGVWVAAVFCGVAATALAFLGQVYGQRVVPASRAAILLLIEPVSAAAFGYVTGERLGWNGAAGAVTILVGVIVAELGPRQPPALGGELALPDAEPQRIDPDS